jgi:hypothetical protein
MPKLANYSELVHQVVREAQRPLTVQEVFTQVQALRPITTADPLKTIRAALSVGALIARVDDQHYGWKPRVISGAVLRLPLADKDLQGPHLRFTEEVRDALWPAFFAVAKYGDRNPVQMRLPNQKRVPFPLELLAPSTWGTSASPEFWTWLGTRKPKPGDALEITVLDGMARKYAVAFEPSAKRDEALVAARNKEILQAALEFFRKKPNGAALWDISTHLLVTGRYHNPVPPDVLETIWTRDIWEPELEKKPVRSYWAPVDRSGGDPLVASLQEDLRADGSSPKRNLGRSKQKSSPTAQEGSIYRLKVELCDTRPAIWRRLLVSSETNLLQLHAVLQLAMGWSNSHLHSFRVGQKNYSLPHPEDLDELGFEDERGVTVAQAAPQVGDRLTYTYDFGDDWLHEITLEAVVPTTAGLEVPSLLDGAGACPPEDVGGPPGFENFCTRPTNTVPAGCETPLHR